jgi:hypothetical protein
MRELKVEINPIITKIIMGRSKGVLRTPFDFFLASL